VIAILGRMQDSWPSAEHDEQRASPLPRVEDIPYVERGYDPERVREAFDAFYRHLARLDATLRTVEAVEVFRDQAGELRKELRALRTAGWTQQPWLPSYSARETMRPGVPEAVFRWAAEACFVIAVPVAAAVADLRSLWIVVAAAGAFAIVAVTEWVAAREGDVLPAPASPPVPAPVAEEPPVPLPPAEPAPVEATEWNLPPPIEEAELRPGPEEPEEQEELTFVGEAEAAEAAEAVQAEPAPEAEEPEERPRLGFLRRREIEEAQVEPDEPEPAELVAEAEPEVAATAEPEPEPEPAAAAAAEPEEPKLAELLEEPEPEVVAEAEPEPAAVAAAEAEPESEWAVPAPQPEEPVAEEEPKPPRRRLLPWRRQRVEEEEAEVEPYEDRPRHVRVLPADVASRVEPLDPWEEELDVEPEAEHEPTPRG
jgi:hypothetical protein